MRSLTKIFTFIYLTIPALVLAQAQGGSGSGVTKIKIDNPIKYNTLLDFVNAILQIVIQVGTPILVLAIVYVGFLFVKARGNSSELENAKTTFFWTVIGAAIVLGAFVISTVIENTISNLGV